MDKRWVGDRALELSVTGLGCNNFGIRSDAEASLAVIHAALDAGITHFDTAHNYGYGNSEKILGSALASVRDHVVIATKFGGEAESDPAYQGASRASVFNSCEDSLRRLGTDYIDLYYQHQPDRNTPIDETLQALADLVSQGKVRHIGCSHFSADEVIAAAKGKTRFLASQSEWNLLHRDIETDLVPTCARLGLAIIPYFPLASGMLTGKYRAGRPFPDGSRLAGSAYFHSEATPRAFETVARLSELGQDSGRTVIDLALAWLAAQRSVASVIVGATRPEQVVENTRALSVQLGPDEMTAIEAVLSRP